MLELGTIAPDFTASSTRGEAGWYDWLGDGWGVLFSYPKAFTGTCASELVAVAQLLADYAAAGVKVAAVSTDSVADQARFGSELGQEHGCPTADIMQFADQSREIAMLYGMVHPHMHEQLAMRVLYVLDPSKKIRLLMAYPPQVARDFAGILGNIRVMQERDAKG